MKKDDIRPLLTMAEDALVVVAVDEPNLCVYDFAQNMRSHEIFHVQRGMFNSDTGQQYYLLCRRITGCGHELKVGDKLRNLGPLVGDADKYYPLDYRVEIVDVYDP